MKDLVVIKSVSYKNEAIVKVEDQIGQQFDIILGVYYLFASTADAKRHIDGQPLKHEVEQNEEKVNWYCNQVEVWAVEQGEEEPEAEEQPTEEPEAVDVTAEEVGDLAEVLAEEPNTEGNTEEPETEQPAEEKKAKKEKVTYFYFAVTLQDFDDQAINVDNAIDGLREDSRKEMQRKLNEAGHTSDTRWVIVGAEQGGKIVGYGLNKEEAVNARWAA